jgi:hypothetical protein
MAENRGAGFGYGLVEDVVGAMASLPDLVVISGGSTLRYRESPPGRRSPTRSMCAMCSQGAFGGAAIVCASRRNWPTPRRSERSTPIRARVRRPSA